MSRKLNLILPSTLASSVRPTQPLSVGQLPLIGIPSPKSPQDLRDLKGRLTSMAGLKGVACIAGLMSLLVFSSASAQGVWADPACGVEASCGAEASCGIEVSCGTEVACGCEAACTCEPSCGFEPTCGFESSCGFEPSCGWEPACGIEADCGCDACSPIAVSSDCEKGLLTRNWLPKNGPLFHVLDTVAGGLEKVATHRLVGYRTARSPAAKSCSCSHCGNHVETMHDLHSHDHGHAEVIEFTAPDAHRHPHSSPAVQATPLPPTPVIPSPLHEVESPKTTIRRTVPLPIPTPAPAQEGSSRGRAGSTFDRLIDPFEDDSASRTATRNPQVRQTTFTEDSPSRITRSRNAVPRSPAESSRQNRTEADDFSDYFRRE